MDEKEINKTDDSEATMENEPIESTDREEVLAEKDAESEKDNKEKPYDVSKIKIDSYPMTLFQAMRKLEKNEIELHPEFQRNEVWNEIRQCRLIESLMIGIPMPAFYIDARDPDEWSMVDGLQRMATFKKFYLDKTLKLKGLEFLKELNEKNFDELPRQYQRRIEEAILQLFLIQPDTPEDAIFTIFYRINTGGAPLTAQEIRHALNKGEARHLLARLSASEEFLNATTWSISYKRMDDRECVLRFLAFYLTDYRDYRKSDLNAFLSDTMKRINKMSKNEIKELEYVFKEAMIKASLVFDCGQTFRKIYAGATKRSLINKALFEVESVLLRKYSYEVLESNSDKIYRHFVALMESDRKFNDSITQGTGSVDAVRERFGTFEKMLEECLS